jgi:hypothetical protein
VSADLLLLAHHHHVTNQAIASMQSTPERKEKGALLQNVCKYYAHPKPAQDTQQYA